MNLKGMQSASLFISIIIMGAANAGQNQLQQMEFYRQQGITKTDPQQGQKLWSWSVNKRSCTSCHGDNPGNVGKHVKTGKTILPMALSVNPDRFQSSKNIEKWFFRNCKWTFGRECSLQEKADILTWLSSQ